MRSQLTLALVAMAMASLDDLHHGGSTRPEESPEEKAASKERRRQEALQEQQRRDDRDRQWKAEQDAIAAPYREARRLRNLRKIQQQVQRPS